MEHYNTLQNLNATTVAWVIVLSITAVIGVFTAVYRWARS